MGKKEIAEEDFEIFNEVLLDLKERAIIGKEKLRIWKDDYYKRFNRAEELIEGFAVGLELAYSIKTNRTNFGGTRWNIHQKDPTKPTQMWFCINYYQFNDFKIEIVIEEDCTKIKLEEVPDLEALNFKVSVDSYYKWHEPGYRTLILDIKDEEKLVDILPILARCVNVGDE